MTDHRPLSELTPSELRTLALMAEGLSNRAIAERCFLSLRTVEANIHAILSKLELPQGGHLHRRVAAVLVYYEFVPGLAAAAGERAA